MRTTYITKMPDKAGAFLKASRAISAHGGNIVRVSYNKAVDVHTLFVEVDADAAALERISEELGALGYLPDERQEGSVILVVLTLPDVPGAVTPVLEVLCRREASISYVSSQENGTGFQYFKMGILVERPHEVKDLLDELSRLCEVRILEYAVTEKQLDGTVFYIGFANELRALLGLTQEQTNEALINANRIMQLLDERDEAPLKTFDYIRRFARFIVDHKGERFNARVSRRRLTDRVTLHAIEPPCGSSTYVLEDRGVEGGDGSGRGELLFVDCGFACYEHETLLLLKGLFDDFDERPKRVAVTHGDIDHTGNLHLFDEVLLSASCYENFALERAGLPDFREQNPLHAPYSMLSKLITGYRPPNLDAACVVGERSGDGGLLERIGELSFADMRFDVYEGAGGHVRGETVLACDEAGVAFTGDIVVNIKGFSPEQRAFNELAPYLMTSVNVDSELARAERNEVMARFGSYLLCPGHGPVMGRPLWGCPTA